MIRRPLFFSRRCGGRGVKTSAPDVTVWRRWTGRTRVPKAVSVSLPHPADVHLGFVPLLDAAPLILAAELGYFADEGLTVALHRQIGWGNVRDKLVYGQLHASHALVGMPPASVLGLDRFPEPVV